MERDAFPEDSCFAWIECSEEVVHQICGRAMLIKTIYSVWSSGETWSQLLENLSSCPSEVQQPFLKNSWCIRVKCLGSSKAFKVTKKEIGSLKFCGRLS